ncbi:MAG: YciI family protein [Hyphomicrobiales bacterium]
MQYMLIFAETEAERSKRNDQAQAPQYWGGWMSFIGAMQEAGVMVSGNGLEPPDVATTVRIRNGKRLVEDGPFADSKEQLGGYVIVDVPDLDAALHWAAKAPCASAGAVEVRPVMPPPPGQ